MNAAAQSPDIEWAPPPDSLRLDFCGLSLSSPIVLLSGCVGFGEDYPRVAGFTHRDVGAVCLQGTTLAPRAGHPPHRVYESAMGLLNATGLQNPGVDHVVSQVLPRLDFGETRFFANIAGDTPEEFAEVARRFDASPIDALEINLSPGDMGSDDDSAATPEFSARVIDACRRVATKPLIAKLGAGQVDIRLTTRLCIEAGADAFSVINTVRGLAVDIHRRAPVLGRGHGGLSGPAIKPIALLKVHQVYQVARLHRIPVIGQGGITSANDALEFLIAGATCVGLGTGLFYDPLLCRKVNTGIAEYLAAQGFSSVAELTGTLADTDISSQPSG